MSLRSYPKIFALGHRAVADLLTGPVVVQEKVDGSQISFGLVAQETAPNVTELRLLIRSRNAEIEPEAPDSLFAPAVETIKRIASLLVPGWTYRGEAFRAPKHNALAYSRVPVGNLILFDVDGGYESYATPATLAMEGARLGLEVVPTLYTGEGRGLDMDTLKGWLGCASILGGVKVEGVVIKGYGRYGQDGKTLMGKFVSEEFKEIHAEAWGHANPGGKDVVGRLIAELKTPARWEKAIQHLREAGTLQGAPQDIGPALKELNADVRAECTDYIKEALFAWAWKHVIRGVQSGFPQWYKEKLAEKAFGAERGGNEGIFEPCVEPSSENSPGNRGGTQDGSQIGSPNSSPEPRAESGAGETQAG